MVMSIISALAAGGPKYSVSGATISHSNPSDAHAGLRVNTDGTTDRLINVTYSQINLDDWVIPNQVASAMNHWVKFERISGDTSDFTGTLSTWLALSSNREIKYDVTGPQSRSGVYSVEIAADSGGTLVLAGPTNYTLSADGTP